VAWSEQSIPVRVDAEDDTPRGSIQASADHRGTLEPSIPGLAPTALPLPHQARNRVIRTTKIHASPSTPVIVMALLQCGIALTTTDIEVGLRSRCDAAVNQGGTGPERSLAQDFLVESRFPAPSPDF
jgi:hypothetical protein